ncbi:hypothetical protein AHAS_Ahas01G0122900 [Arachis hypogaea]
MAPYEALYGRKCQSPLCWYEAGEKSLLGPEMIAETTEQVKKIRDRMLTAQSRQKSYADQRRKPLEFEEGDHVFLKVTPTTGVGRAIKEKKLNPRYIGPFQILERIGPVAYRMALPSHLSNLHDVFHVSQLRKYTPDASHVLEPESVQLREDLTLPVAPVRIDDTSIKRLRGKEVSLVKVAWSRGGVEEHTWELESEMRTDYPHLFSELRLPPRLRPRVHCGELYKTHTTNLEDPTLLKEKVNLVSLDLGCGKNDPLRVGALGACAPFFPKMPYARTRDVRGHADCAAPNAQPFSRELCQNCASVVPGAREHPRVRVVDAVLHLKDPIAVSLSSSLKEELLKDDYVYIPSDNDSPLKMEQQPCKEARAPQSEQEAPVDVCPGEPEKQAAEESSPRKTEPQPPLNVSPPKEQQQPCQEALVAQKLEEEAQLDFCFGGLEKQAMEESFPRKMEPQPPLNIPPEEQQLPCQEVPVARQLEEESQPNLERKKITKELKEKSYHLMTHVKETKDSTDQYDPLFILNHKENFEGLIHHFMSLIPGEQVESTVVNTHCMILNDIKCPQFEKDIYYVPTDIVETMARITLIQRPRRPTGSMSIDVHTNASVLTKENSHRIYLGYWWLWIADVRKKEFYVLDSANKKKKEIPDLRIKLNKIVGLIISQMKVYTGAEPLMEEGDREEAEYIRLNGQRTRKRLMLLGLNMVQTLSSTN